MKGKKVIYNGSMLFIGLVLIVLGVLGKVDEFWSGMGSALCVVGGLRIMRTYRLNKIEDYREKVEVEMNDERNRFLRAKAWAWAGYLFVIITALAVLAFKAAGQELLSFAACGAECLILVLYWGAYMILKKKY